MQAVGNELGASKQTKSVVYVTSEQFVVEFLEYIRYKKKGFADKYRSADVLIVDDIQFIAGKERTEEEFFHTFNALHQSDKQIILSSDQPPNSIPTLEDRLRSRFSGGMIVDVQAPDFETRCAILQAKAGEHDIDLDQETVEYFATQIQSNIRELEGSLNQVLAFCELKAITPTIDVVRSMIGNRPTQPKRLTTAQVVERTAKYFELDLDEITGPKRNKAIVVPRQIAMYLLRSELHMSFPKVATALGRKDHTTAIHSVEKIEKNIHLDQQMNQDVKQIKDLLYA
jgi:chromosomal replication initiator protein